MERGQAQVVSLVGEAGAGKSRLIAEFLARLDAGGRLAGIAVRRAACSSLGEPTYGVFGALFRDAYRVEPGDSLDVARQKLTDGLRALGAPVGDRLGQLQDFVAARASGNPLFAEEIVRSLVGKGVLVRQGDRWSCTEAPEALDVPPTLQGLMLSRIDQLPADARRLIQEAAVLGVVFDETLLREVATVSGAFERAIHP